MIKKRNIAAIATLLMMLLATVPVEAAISKNFDLNDNFYTVYGGPDIEATLLGDNEYSRGDTFTLNLGLMNKGVISGFESEKEADTTVDTVLQRSEMGYETQAVTAVGVLATLKSDSPYISVKSGSQEAGTLEQGKQSVIPSKFVIEISENAPAGTYPLNLEFSYKYQNNVQVSGDNYDTSTGLVSNQGVGIWYENVTQNQTIIVQVKKEPYFEVTNVTGDLYPGKNGNLQVTYKNTGEEPAKDATVRLSASDPFSTTDDQAFLGNLKPGESAVAIFDMDVDDTATSKPYSLTSEVLYKDTEGHNQISDSVKINTKILEAKKSLPGYQIGIGIAMVLAACFVVLRKKKQD
ncbi:putative carboxyl-terminal-processing protease, deltaproteobacterial [Methanosarcina lacustris Z-7289]|uniref:Putative carboxyl-terminal-processing protease, deltaproteobacterial n=1 Tax=Methanosarcina lacustris Z-7289 TaxID=1434111 RepID=A0A0E3S139_9EURY|nr:COG1361 S-layer family protein [Methanosarcina lacustris]AKB74414.1 putative carboxyl-terminal-processing protease, deltaproteobacterial [Methanosarcina lacustris Z-7289]